MRILVLFVFIFSLTCCGQDYSTQNKDSVKIEKFYPIARQNRDSTVKVTKERLLDIVHKGEEIGESKKIEDFTNDEHILVIMLLNSKTLFTPNKDSELNSAYDNFNLQFNYLEYAEKSGKILKWIPNKGLGMYFTDLDIDFGGSKMNGWGFFELIK